MKAKRPCPHRYPSLETLEPRLSTGNLLFGGLALAGFDALGEATICRSGSLEDVSSRTGVRAHVRAGNGGEPTLDGSAADSVPVHSPASLPDWRFRAPGAARQADIGSPTDLIYDTIGTAQIPLRLEQIDDLPAPAELLPKNRPDLRSRPADVRQGPYDSVQVNVDKDGLNIVGDAANESTIATRTRMGTTNRQQIVIGWRQFDTVASNYRQAGYNRSRDAGSTWKTASVLQPGAWRTDPVLASSRDGHIYYLSLNDNFDTDVFITANGGTTWSAPQFAYGGDKSWFTIDNTGGMGDGHLYQSWNIAGNNYYPNIFNRSVNGGVNWSFPTSIPQRPVFGTLDVGSDGALYVVGVPDQSFSQMVVSKSTNAQDASVPPTFTSVNVSMGGSMELGEGPNPGGLLGQAWIAVDRSGGATHNNIYVLCSVNPSGSDPMDVHLIRSTDGGLTWSAPLRVNDDPVGNNAWQWFGTMSVAPNGRIDVIWNDTRHSLSDNSISEVHYSYSYDGGVTFSKNIQLTPAWDSHVGWPNQNKIGDYYHMVSEKHAAALAYAATFNGEQDVYFLRLGDCNKNFVHDGIDILNGYSKDADQNLIPDECE